ncbi:MAG: hypothetical protein M5U28_09525 [Sandaracinaceae bacterium]|nr:hypothetical protein [Sandaracinaceae bacterium]
MSTEPNASLPVVAEPRDPYVIDGWDSRASRPGLRRACCAPRARSPRLSLRPRRGRRPRIASTTSSAISPTSSAT